MNFIYSLIKLSSSSVTGFSLKWLVGVFYFGISGICNLILAITPLGVRDIFIISTIIAISLPLIYLIYPGYKIREGLTKRSDGELLLYSFVVGILTFLIYMISIYVLFFLRK